MSALDSTSTRWQHRNTGERLVAVTVKRTSGASMVFPVRMGREPHPLDWMPEAAFLAEYEPLGAA